MSNSYEATGPILAIMDTQQINDTFRKREFVVEVPDGNYPQAIKFQVVQDKTDMLDAFDVGDEVTVSFNLRGREFTRRSDGSKDYWINLDCWRLEKAGGDAGASPAGVADGGELDPPPFDDKDVPF